MVKSLRSNVKYLRNNLVPGIKTPPKFRLKFVLLPVVAFAAVSFVIGGLSGLFVFRIIKWQAGLLVLPLTMFVFPAFLEEAFFRGVLIPRDAAGRSGFSIAGLILLSAAAFTLWHPFNAYFFNPSAQHFFLNTWFLIIVFFLGITCGLAYVYSRSLWTPVLIHWVTILVWVFLLGGHNLVAGALNT